MSSTSKTPNPRRSLPLDLSVIQVRSTAGMIHSLWCTVVSSEGMTAKGTGVRAHSPLTEKGMELPPGEPHPPPATHKSVSNPPNWSAKACKYACVFSLAKHLSYEMNRFVWALCRLRTMSGGGRCFLDGDKLYQQNKGKLYLEKKLVRTYVASRGEFTHIDLTYTLVKAFDSLVTNTHY